MLLRVLGRFSVGSSCLILLWALVIRSTFCFRSLCLLLCSASFVATVAVAFSSLAMRQGFLVWDRPRCCGGGGALSFPALVMRGDLALL